MQVLTLSVVAVQLGNAASLPGREQKAIKRVTPGRMNRSQVSQAPTNRLAVGSFAEVLAAAGTSQVEPSMEALKEDAPWVANTGDMDVLEGGYFECKQY